jgi:Mn2+/Fe2+ NRAMP family transporter
MNKVLAVTLGIVSSIGGFFDMGEIVMTAETGARFGFALVWVVALGTIGIIVYAEMAGRIATLTKRPVFDIVRERLGAKVGLMNLSASVLINLITLIAEIAGVAIAFQLVSTINYYLWIPLAVILVLVVIWKVSFEHMERAVGFAGMAMLVFAFAFFKLGPDLGAVFKKIIEPDVPHSETLAAYWYFAVALFGAAMTPYEVFFYSSGAVEEKWEKRDLMINKVTAYIGFGFGAILAISAIGVAALLFKPQGITIETLSQVALGPAVTIGTLGLALFIVGLFAATFGAALEVTLSTGYCLAQYFGWTWGKFEKPRDAARFHLSMIVLVVLAALLLLTSVDPVKVTELAVVFSAIGLPLTYFPVLVVANDREYMGDQVNGRVLNAVASIFLLLVVVVSVSAIPLMIWTRMGS